MRIHRYPGVKPFSEVERDVFYGRTNDTKKLFQLINLERLVLLYSKSGLGKSSLLNAGVLPLFDEFENYTTVKIRFGAYLDQSESPVSKCLFKLPAAPSNSLIDKLGAGSDTLWLRMKALQALDIDAATTYILVFDQFEELFTYTAEDRKVFKRQLADLLYAKVPSYISKSVTNRLRENPDFLSNNEMELLYRQLAVKVVLSIRSDRMSQLNSLADYIPDVQKNYYELRALDRDSAVDSIKKPALDTSDVYLSPPFLYSGDCIEKILDYLTANGQKGIETFQLQTVCQYAENLAIENQLPYNKEDQSHVVEAELLGELQNIFRTQYDKLINNIEPAGRQIAARILIEDKLIIDGNRVSLPDVVILKEKGIDKDLITYLHDTNHLLRSEPNTTDGISYELSHDTLVAPILKAKKEREELDKLARLENERLKELKMQQESENQEKLRRDSKRLRLVYIFLAVALIALFFAGLFGYKARNSNNEAEKLLEDVKKQKHRADSTAKLYERMLEVAIGKIYQGGIVFSWNDKTGKHGVIAAKKDLPGTYSWQDAKNAISHESINGYTDWRLPTETELFNLYGYKSYKNDTSFTQERYWSSREGDNGSPVARFQQFSNGLQSFSKKSTLYHVWPVRSF